MDSECSDIIEIIKTKVIINDYIYVFQKEVGDGFRYTCVQRKKHYCKGSVTINSSKSKILKFQKYSHNPDSAEAEVCCALNATKENIINNFDIPSKVYAKEVTKLTDVAACLMPNENNVKRNLRRIRNNSYPTISSKEFVLEGKWTMTAEPNQQKFLFYDNRSINSRIIIFASQDCLEILSQSDHVFMDGTFSSCPKGFYQLYVLHVIYKMKPLSVVYALLPKKTQTVYVELLMTLKDTCSSVKSFSIDFELALIKAIEEGFEDSVSIHLCYYHLSQSVWRKVQNLGLASKYTKDKEFRCSVRMINALAF